MNELLAENDGKKLLELKINNPDITNTIYSLSDDNKNKVLEHIKNISEKTDRIHILTDIDDTIYPSRYGGSDLSFKHHTVYPGVVSFYKYVVTTDFVTLLTARPKSIYRDTRETISKEIGQKVDILNGSFTDINLGVGVDFVKRLLYPIISSKSSYPSTIDHLNGVDPIKWYSNYKDIANTKFESIKKYSSIYPEFNFIFIGDSGQGDLICAYKLYEHKSNNPDFPISASFIHNIIKSKEAKYYKCNEKLRMIQDEEFIQSLNQKNIYLFNNYIDLAGKLYSLNIITYKVLDKIINETLIDFKENKKSNVYYQEPLYISYIENELTSSAMKYAKDI
jgi:hypothetical protein